MQKLKEEVRESIIKASKSLFKEKGFEETSMHDIAKVAGISTGNIYRYFLTKQKILDEILDEMGKEFIMFFNMLPSVYPVENHEQVYNSLFEKMIYFAEEKNDELNILFRCENQIQFISFKKRIIDLFVDKIEQIVGSTENGKYIDKTLCASLAVSIFSGVAIIVKENNKDLTKLRENLYNYKKIVIDNLDKRLLGMAIE